MIPDELVAEVLWLRKKLEEALKLIEHQCSLLKLTALAFEDLTRAEPEKPIMSFKRIQELVQDKAGQGPGWVWTRAEWVGTPGSKRDMEVTGAVYPFFRGVPDWTRPVDGTFRKVVITGAEIEAFENGQEGDDGATDNQD